MTCSCFTSIIDQRLINLASFDRSDQNPDCSNEAENYVNHRSVRSHSGRFQPFSRRSINGGSSLLDERAQASLSAPPTPSSFLDSPAQNARLLSSSLLPRTITPPSPLDDPLTQDQSPSRRWTYSDHPKSLDHVRDRLLGETEEPGSRQDQEGIKGKRQAKARLQEKSRRKQGKAARARLQQGAKIGRRTASRARIQEELRRIPREDQERFRKS